MLQKLTAAHMLLLTGTPVQNNLGELINIFAFIAPLLFQTDDTDRLVTLFEEAGKAQAAKKKSRANKGGAGAQGGKRRRRSRAKGKGKFDIEERGADRLTLRLGRALRPFVMRRCKVCLFLKIFQSIFSLCSVYKFR
jgi:SNF2 family DNA or RNA helicase